MHFYRAISCVKGVKDLMTLEMWITAIILVGMFALLIKTKVPPVVVFVGALTLTITFRLAPLEESLNKH